MKTGVCYKYFVHDYRQIFSRFLLSSPVKNKLAPVSSIFLYFLAEFFGFSFNPGTKLDRHRGTWTGCIKFYDTEKV